LEQIKNMFDNIEKIKGNTDHTNNKKVKERLCAKNILCDKVKNNQKALCRISRKNKIKFQKIFVKMKNLTKRIIFMIDKTCRQVADRIVKIFSRR